MCSSGSPSDSPTQPRKNLTSADVSSEVFAHVEKESSWILEQLHAAAAARIDDPAVAEVVAGQERLLNTELAAAFGALASMVDQVVAAAVGAGLATDQLAGLLQPLQQRQRMLRMLRAQGGRTSPTTAGCPSARFSSSPGPTRFSTAGRESPWKKVRNSRAQIVGARADGTDGGVDGRASRVSPAMAAFATAAIERAREQQREGGGSCSASSTPRVRRAPTRSIAPRSPARCRRRTACSRGGRRGDKQHRGGDDPRAAAPQLEAAVALWRQCEGGARRRRRRPRRVSKGMQRLCSMRFPARAAPRGRRRRPRRAAVAATKVGVRPAALGVRVRTRDEPRLRRRRRRRRTVRDAMQRRGSLSLSDAVATHCRRSPRRATQSPSGAPRSRHTRPTRRRSTSPPLARRAIPGSDAHDPAGRRRVAAAERHAGRSELSARCGQWRTAARPPPPPQAPRARRPRRS